jgi:hypothetical protein
MAEGYCWVCDRPVDHDPCPTCGTALYRRPESARSEDRSEEILDTTSAMRPAFSPRGPFLIGLVVLVAIVVLVVVFQAGAGIS